MIYLKLILAFLLSVLPFFYMSYIKPKEKTSPVWRNMFTVLGTQLPRLRAAKRAVENFFHRLYDGMKKSNNFRKFFTLIILLLTIAMQFVDFSASTSITRMIQNSSHDSQQTSNIIALCGPLMTHPHATLLAACLSMILFSYTAADWMLTSLHNQQKFFFGIALLALVILFSSPHYLIVTEVLEIMLLSALVYPNKIPSQDPKGRKRIPMVVEQRTLEKAA